ncbi:uncharacterized protein LOC125342689 [Perognathus longimembris pacificus]|uniref:uncharacterized protein LOC125342689 n=1 Tax=Perognathus longimembris pacificus TaxID=214514 RepID=UPI0020184D6F|nr:uncharacterized protein LOC125342689 [Perognathus longimembris pacificus]
MEATKKVGGPDPSGPQDPSPSGQQPGGGLRESQGQWVNSGSLYLKQGLSLPIKPNTKEACGPASHANVPEPVHQLPPDSAQVSSQPNHEQASQDAVRLSSANPFPSPTAEAQQHLIMDDGTLTLPVYTGNNGTSDTVRYRSTLSRLQLQIGKDGKAPAKVLIGWGKGSCNLDQVTPLGPRKSRWLPYTLSGENGLCKSQGLILDSPQAPDQAVAQDRGQNKYPCPAQTPAVTTVLPSPSFARPTPAQARTPAPNVTPIPAAVEPYTCTLDPLTDNTVVNKDPSRDLCGKCSNRWPNNFEPFKMAAPRQNKVNFHPCEGPVIPACSPEFPRCTQEYNVTKRQMPPEQSEDLADKPTDYTFSPGTPKSDREPGTLKSQKNCHNLSNCQPDKQFPKSGHNYGSSVPLSYHATYQKQFPPQMPGAAMQFPTSSAPTCQLQNAVEDHVLVFDMATGNTRMGLMCHDPMGPRAVLVGLMPTHPPIYVPENGLSMANPALSPDSNNSKLWSTTAMLSSPVPSSLSSGSYPEISLLPKEATHNLGSRNYLAVETPVRLGVLTQPVPLGMPNQLGESIVTHVPDPSWSTPDMEKNEPGPTIWVLESSRTPDTSMAQNKKHQWMKSDPLTNSQVVPGSLIMEDVSGYNQKEVVTAHPNNPQVKDVWQIPLPGQTFLNGQNVLARQLPTVEKGSLVGQPSATKASSFTNLPSLAGQSPLARQFAVNGQLPLTGKSPIPKVSTLPREHFTSGEPSQGSIKEDKPALGLPSPVGVLRVPLAPEETCLYVNRDKVSANSAQGFSVHQLPSWPPGNCPRASEEQPSLITFATPGTSCKVVPMATVGTEPQNGNQFKLTAEDITCSSVVAHLGLLRGSCYELVSTMDALPVRSPVLYRHTSGPYQNMAAIVIDTGTGFTKCGLAGEDHVLNVVPSQVHLLQHAGQGQPQYAVPENQEGSYPVLNRGVVSDWDALEVLWQHLFYCRLGVKPEQLAVLVADSPISPRTNREKVAEILFERFHVPAMQTVHQALLTLYAYGRTTGLVLGSGHGTSYVAPILTGDLGPLDTYRLDVAGADLTDYLAQLLLAGGHSPPKAGLVNQIKEACCYVAMDMEAEMARTQSQARLDFVLPDKQIITLGTERFCCPEALFQPNLLGLNQPGLPQLALLSISQLEATQQKQLLANVVLEGGSTLVSGFPERLRQELGPDATVLGSPHRAVAAWLGGSIMACRSSFQSLWLSRHEYEEEGPWAIYKYQL